MSDISLHTIQASFEETSNKLSKQLLKATNDIRKAKTENDVYELRKLVELMNDDLIKLRKYLNSGNYKDEENLLEERRRFVVEKFKKGIDEIEMLILSIKIERVNGVDEGIFMENEQDKDEIEIDSNENNGIKFQIQHTPINAEEIEIQEYEAMQREIEINKIVNSVGELNQIFHDMDALVLSQGEMIDNIENNIYNTLENTRLASRELRKADNWDKKRRRCSWILIFAAVIGIFILLALIA
jgi:syntaxin 7